MSSYPNGNGNGNPQIYENTYSGNNAQASYPPPPFPIGADQSQNEGVSPTRAVALLSIGSALGLTAAAAVRWLNGGDFELMPSAGRESDLAALRLEAARELSSENRERQNAVEVQNEKLSSNLKSLVESLQSHTQQNERIVQRLTSIKESRLTDNSVDLLRNKESDIISSTAVYLKLAEIQAELSSLRRDMVALQIIEHVDSETTAPWENRLSTTMKSLDSCLVKLQPDSRQPRSFDEIKRQPQVTSVAGPKVEWDAARRSRLTLWDAIKNLVQHNDSKEMRKGAQVLYLFVINLSSQPHIPRYRKVVTTNASFQTISKITGAVEVLRAVGFIERDDGKLLEWLSGESAGEKEENEGYYIVELKKAAVALGILKNPSTRPLEELLQTTQAAVLAEERRLTGDSEATPMRSTNTTPSPHTDFPPPQTPDVGSIVSPPMTRKHPYLPATDLTALMEPQDKETSKDGAVSAHRTKEQAGQRMHVPPSNSDDSSRSIDDTSVLTPEKK